MSSIKPEVNAGLPDIFREFPADRFNQLLPTTTYWAHVGPMQKASVDVVKISPDPNDGDVYRLANGKLALHKKGLSKLALAAGVGWHPELSRVEERTRDYCRFRAVGAMKKGDGTLLPIHGTYDMHLDDVRDDLIREYTAKAKKDGRDKVWIDAQVQRDFAQKRRYITRLCETGAMDAAIRFILQIDSYTPEQLAKPFAVPRIDFAPDVSDPDVKRFLLEQGSGATHQLYPPPAAQRISAPAETVVENGRIEEAAEDDDLDAALGASPQGETVEDQVATFAANDMEEQVRIFGELVKAKSYPIGTKDAPSPLRKLWKTDRVGAYRQLLNWKAGE